MKLLDCTIRDGGYINDWDFPMDFAIALYKAISVSGIHYMEAGFLNPSYKGKNQWKHVSNDTIRRLKKATPNGAKISLLLNFGDADADTIASRSPDSADLIRVAAHKDKKEVACELAKAIQSKGYECSVNFMGISSYSDTDITELKHLLSEYQDKVDYFYIADSFGSLLPSDTQRILTLLTDGMDAPIGLHPHNNLQLAFANSLLAIDAGIAMVDGSVLGMGRGGGNLCTEAMLAYLVSSKIGNFDLLPLLKFTDLYMLRYQQQYSWGYSLPQLISGILGCHPNYPSHLLRNHSQTADHIYKILQNIPDAQKSRFKPETLQKVYASFTKGDQRQSSLLLELAKKHKGKLLVLCSGSSVQSHQAAIQNLITESGCCVISINNPQSLMASDLIFFGNDRRLETHHTQISPDQRVAIGPLIGEAPKHLNPIRLGIRAEQSHYPEAIPSNSGIQAVAIAAEHNFNQIWIAGMDGFVEKNKSYYYDEPDRHTETEYLNRQLELELDATKAQFPELKFDIITPTYFSNHYTSKVLQL